MDAVTSTGHVLGQTRNVYKILAGKSEGKRPQGNLRLDGRIILK
jgi:hypothetical protein